MVLQIRFRWFALVYQIYSPAKHPYTG
uniref:Uncharacterized protein n=1 Tax=Rhizophora mucronata TaxID=61149 RepID=A0A2P2NMU7_RHIMU